MIPISGRRQRVGDEEQVVWQRNIVAPLEDVWRTLTDPDRLEAWIGTWSGDPASGRIEFRMTAEGDDAPAEPQLVEVCEPPRRFRVRSDAPDPAQAWTLDVALTHDDGVTTLRFAQVITPELPLDMIGPGWEYYLDRFVAAQTGQDIGEIDWADYEPLMADYTARLDGTHAAGPTADEP